MALDFALDDRGDFMLSTPPTHQRLRLSWINSNHPVLKLSFEQGQPCSERKKYTRLRIDFIADRDSRVAHRKFTVVNDRSELRQRIMIRLRTEKGEMKLFEDLGSFLVTQRHEDIMSDKVKAYVESIVLLELSDILARPKVVAVPKRKDGPFFCQNMNVYIYENEELVYVLSL